MKVLILSGLKNSLGYIFRYKYGICRAKRLRTHSVQEITANADVEIRV